MSVSEFKRISKRAKALLAGGKAVRVGYREDADALQAEDIVAFANSRQGGSILLGVKRGSGAGRRSSGNPVGCPVGKEAVQQILQTAAACMPPVPLAIFVENTAATAFIRIEIPASDLQPHCTEAGTYTIRDRGRNKALHPERLLEMLHRRHNGEPPPLPSAAGTELETALANTLALAEKLEQVMKAAVAGRSRPASAGSDEPGAAQSILAVLEAALRPVQQKTEYSARRLKAVLAHLQAPDPVIADIKKDVLAWLVDKLAQDEELLAGVRQGKAVSLTLKPDYAAELAEADMQEILAAALNTLNASKP